MDLIERLLAGDKLSLARLISLVERESPEVPLMMGQLQSYLGRAYAIGITGPPGAGKSTLVDKLIALFRAQKSKVGVIAVDPTSPFSGGAVLGDRIRMQQHYLDEGVFIRSMATRGSRGGLPRTASGVVKLMDAFGMDYVLLETVGVGQTELDIIEASDCVVVVLVPEAGDAIQTMKAGLLEIADIFVVNKADREGANYLVSELKAMLSFNSSSPQWQPPVLPAQALNNVGMEEVFQAVLEHRHFQQESGELARRRREQRKREFLNTLVERLGASFLALIEEDDGLQARLEQVMDGGKDPYSTCQELLQDRGLREKWLNRVA